MQARNRFSSEVRGVTLVSMSQAKTSPLGRPFGTAVATARAAIFVALLTGNLFPTVGGFSLATAAAIVAAPWIVFELLRYLPRIHPVIPFCIVVFLVLILPGVIESPITQYGQEKFEKITTSLLLSAMAVVLIRDRRGVKILAWVWLFAATVLAIATIFGGTGVGTRAVGFGSNPIWLGRELTSGFLVALWLMWQKRLGTIPGLVVLSAIGAALVATESRGPLLAALLAVIVFLVGAAPKVSETAAAGIIFSAGSAVAALYFVPASLPERVSELLLSPGSAVESSLRTDLWSVTMPMIAENPFGVGYGNWSAEAATLIGWPHNLFLEVFAEAGWIPGITLVFATAVVVVRLARRSRGDSVASLVLALLVAAIVEVSASGDLNARTFFALLALGWVATTWARPDCVFNSETRVPVAQRTCTAPIAFQPTGFRHTPAQSSPSWAPARTATTGI